VIGCVQSELETAQSQFEKADSRAATLGKQTATLEAQLTEAQESLQDETRQKLAAQTRQRQAEDQASTLHEQMEEEEQGRKQVEAKVIALNTQVNKIEFVVLFYVQFGPVLDHFYDNR
jgi:chromosome segregation ATPase